MSEKGKNKRTKEELMNQLFNEKFYSTTKNKTMSKNKSMINVSKTANNFKKNNIDNKGDDFFVTNMKKFD